MGAHVRALVESLYLQTGQTIFLFYFYFILFIYHLLIFCDHYLFILFFAMVIVIIIIIVIIVFICLFVFQHFPRHHLHHTEGSREFNQNMPPQIWEIHDSGQMP